MEESWAVARFTVFGELRASEFGKLATMAGAVRTLKQGETLRSEGDPSPKMYFLQKGWTASSIVVANGTRQMIKVHMPGDLIGAPSLALARACDTIHALSPAAVSVIEPASIGQLFTQFPRLAAMLFLISQEERVRLMDRLASFGRTDAASRLAALILQLHARVLCSNADAGDSFHAPLTQTDLADLTGLSKVHINRTLQQLRGDSIVKWSRRTVTILDAPRLRQMAELTPRQITSDLSWIPA